MPLALIDMDLKERFKFDEQVNHLRENNYSKSVRAYFHGRLLWHLNVNPESFRAIPTGPNSFPSVHNMYIAFQITPIKPITRLWTRTRFPVGSSSLTVKSIRLRWIKGLTKMINSKSLIQDFSLIYVQGQMTMMRCPWMSMLKLMLMLIWKDR